MKLPTGPRTRAGFSAVLLPSAAPASSWHAACIEANPGKKDSHPVAGSVNFSFVVAKSASWKHGRHAWRSCSSARQCDRFGSIHGAGRNGHRKRTHVRAACGDEHRPSGEGNFSTHGHIGRFVVGSFFFHGEATLPLVLKPVCEAVLRQRHLSRGPGLPAALTAHPVTSVRTTAHGNRAFRATRPFSSAVIRAASFPRVPPGMSCGRERRTQPQPTHASATG
jgi:hypothetical protein